MKQSIARRLWVAQAGTESCFLPWANGPCQWQWLSLRYGAPTTRGAPSVWIGKGAVLRGESPVRLAFFRKILSDGPSGGLAPADKWQDYPFAGKAGHYYLGYLGRQAPASWPFALAKPGLRDGMKFRVDAIGTWNMTIRQADGVFETKKRDNYTFAAKDGRSIALPGRPYMGLRIIRVP